MLFRMRLLLAALVLLSPAFAGAYVKPDDVPGIGEFPAPPAPNSADDVADLAAVRDWQHRRTEADCARAQAEEETDFDSLMGAVSPWGAQTPKEAAALMTKARNDTTSAYREVKGRYQRPRPYLRDSSIKPCAAKPGGFSYPSGHATIARVFARVLCDVVPAKCPDFLARADQAGLDRVIAGVHHPTDIEAGKKLGDAVHEALLAAPSYKSDLAAAKATLP